MAFELRELKVLIDLQSGMAFFEHSFLEPFDLLTPESFFFNIACALTSFIFFVVFSQCRTMFDIRAGEFTKGFLIPNLLQVETMIIACADKPVKIIKLNLQLSHSVGCRVHPPVLVFPLDICLPDVAAQSGILPKFFHGNPRRFTIGPF